jgi:7-carboxy-7-deazaguanine synthase (Cx14CxxC type)
VKEVFLSLQGEGAHSGRRAVFLRFSGCNLWTGREEHRATAACRFCDTDFVGTDGDNGGRYDADGLARKVAESWGDGKDWRYVVLTGGEPALQVDARLVSALSRLGFTVAIETNGTLRLPPGIHWITLSPKAGADPILDRCDELKLVYPQDGLAPSRYDRTAAGYRFIQPRWHPDAEARAACAAAAVRFCLDNPRWRLGLQAHKVVGLP